MPELMFVGLFALLVFAPCFAAVGGLRLEGFSLPELDGFSFSPPCALGQIPAPVCALGLERPVTDKFAIRAFAKGLKAHRRELIRDGAIVVARTVERVVEVAVDLAVAVADVPAATEAYPRTRRRRLMLAMLEAKTEGDAWMAKAAAARSTLAALNDSARAGNQYASLAQEAAAEAQQAGARAAQAYYRLARLEAQLQGRPDVQMPATKQVPAHQTLAA